MVLLKLTTKEKLFICYEIEGKMFDEGFTVGVRFNEKEGIFEYYLMGLQAPSDELDKAFNISFAKTVNKKEG